MSLQVNDMTYGSYFANQKVYKEGEQLPLPFGLMPVEMFGDIYSEAYCYGTRGYISRIKPTLYAGVYIGRNEDMLWVPVLRIPDKNFIDNGKVIYQKINSFAGIS